MKRISLLLPACPLLFAGCQTLSSGGAPQPAFDIHEDMQALAKEFQSATNISNYYSAPPEQRVDARNRFISGRLVQIDLNYIEYIRLLTADKQRLDTAAQLADFSLSLAGTLVGGIRSKTNLAAASTGLRGAKTTIDKEYYYEKSLDALVGTMNAKRKEIRYDILTGLASSNVAAYSFETAMTQLNEYYLAGTINGALRFINAQSAAQEKISDDKIRDLPRLNKTTTEIVEQVEKLHDAIHTMTDPQARKALALLDPNHAEIKDPTAVKYQLQELVRGVGGKLTVAQQADEARRISNAFNMGNTVTK